MKDNLCMQVNCDVGNFRCRRGKKGTGRWMNEKFVQFVARHSYTFYIPILCAEMGNDDDDDDDLIEIGLKCVIFNQIGFVFWPLNREQFEKI